MSSHKNYPLQLATHFAAFKSRRGGQVESTSKAVGLKEGPPDNSFYKSQLSLLKGEGVAARKKTVEAKDCKMQ